MWGQDGFLFSEYVEELRIGFLGLEPAKRGRGIVCAAVNLEIRKPSKLYDHRAETKQIYTGSLMQYISIYIDYAYVDD